LNKGNIYITLTNTFIGISASFLLNSSIIIAFVVSFLTIATVLFIERKWINEKIFRQKRWCAITAYSLLAVLLVVGLFFLTKPTREMSLILKNVHVYLNDIKTGDYQKAYEQLSTASKESYSLDYFIKYHSTNNIKIQDFTIDQAVFNQYDKKKAEVVVKSPFLLYGREKLNLEMIKEDKKWCVVINKMTIPDKTSVAVKTGNTKSKKSGVITSFFKKWF
jgi:hypothetical protein